MSYAWTRRLHPIEEWRSVTTVKKKCKMGIVNWKICSKNEESMKSLKKWKNNCVVGIFNWALERSWSLIGQSPSAIVRSWSWIGKFPDRGRGSWIVTAEGEDRGRRSRSCSKICRPHWDVGIDRGRRSWSCPKIVVVDRGRGSGPWSASLSVHDLWVWSWSWIVVVRSINAVVVGDLRCPRSIRPGKSGRGRGYRWSNEISQWKNK